MASQVIGEEGLGVGGGKIVVVYCVLIADLADGVWLSAFVDQHIMLIYGTVKMFVLELENN